ncbi:S9 family peptidase [Nocardia goodfellowii]|uniref:Dipeptidyl aminopeptidase/acylaminoacyl peptidase n=1 Tax=Nocardia goodfellowii TaxID=882446 RepID=A0ABS4QDK7_9NOCA|nr:S9 family peptidase [Nocardia goodfellowii]MBP2189643.1 dipeptidyl aminopeptidase/acylaminoacyl peptidase [Nocardia goodfellowii]
MRKADGMPVLIPRSVLFGSRGRPTPRLSPDGYRIGFIDGVDGVANVWIGPVDNVAAAAPVTYDRGPGIRSFLFCHDRSTLVYVQDFDGDENWRLYALDLSSGEVRLLTPGAGVRATILAHNHFHSNTMLIGLPSDDPRRIDPYRLDLTTGTLEHLESNPGYSNWLIDSDLRIRGGASITADGGREIKLRDLATGRDEPWMTIAPEDTATTGLPTFDRAGNIHMSSGIGSHTKRLIHIDQHTGDHTVLASHDTYDLMTVYSDPFTLRPQSAVFLGDRRIWVHLDPDFGTRIDHLRAQLDGDISISRSPGSDRWLVAESSDRTSTRYHIYDCATDKIAPLYDERPDLAGYQFAAMEPLAFTARDGLTINGYITFPVEQPRADLPAVLLVHGGPSVRDTWGYKPTVQWLANRGYAVIQVNFRGSTGYGKAFINAGDREWGRAMHHDLLDAVDHVVGQGWIDPKRVAIYGGSFGGYAALVGAAFTPDVFCAAISICGPSNLITLINTLSAQYRGQVGTWHRQVGNPDTEHDMLWERSPLSRASDIRIPLMIVQGRNDPRVKVTESDQIAAALTEAEIPHEYLLFDDEGHGIRKASNAERLNAAIEAFLATHLGGRAQAPSS